MEERDNRDVWLNDNYEIRIKVCMANISLIMLLLQLIFKKIMTCLLQELSKLVSDLKREEKPVFVTGNAQILSFADHLVQETKYAFYIFKIRHET